MVLYVSGLLTDNYKLSCVIGEDKMNILVTQTSAFAASSIIKLINRIDNMDITIHGSDKLSKSMNSANQMVDKFHKTPSTENSDQYIESINQICLKNNIDLVIPVMDDEIRIISNHKNDLKFKCIIPEDNIIRLFHDKLEASIAINDIGVPIPNILYDLRNSSKVIFRNRIGIGSHGIYIVDLKEVQYIENRFTPDIFIQDFIDGEEYTVDVLADCNGNPVLIIPRKRITIINGLSYRCKVVQEQSLIDACYKIYSHFKIPGLSNAQFIIKDGNLYFIELNTRFAATGIAGIMASYNYIYDFLNHFVNNEPMKPLEECMKCVAWNSIITRYYEETISYFE